VGRWRSTSTTTAMLAKFCIESTSDTGENIANAFRRRGLDEYVFGSSEDKALRRSCHTKEQCQAALVRSVGILWVRRRKRFPFTYQPNSQGTWVNHIEGECYLTQKNLLASVMFEELGAGAHQLHPESYCVYPTVSPLERTPNQQWTWDVSELRNMWESYQAKGDRSQMRSTVDASSSTLTTQQYKEQESKKSEGLAVPSTTCSNNIEPSKAMISPSSDLPIPLQWILKPSSSSCGRGITLVHGLEWTHAHSFREFLDRSYPDMESLVVQRYISRPLLFHTRKFDIRCYVLIIPAVKLHWTQRGTDSCIELRWLTLYCIYFEC
jgi:hypothetical protein